MLLPAWKKKLTEAAEAGRELRTRQRGNGTVALIAVQPGHNEMIVIDQLTQAQYSAFIYEIEEFYKSVGGTV